jgi:8-oxo-dGTP pyrophosphatase MutT (NUDIX family)
MKFAAGLLICHTDARGVTRYLLQKRSKAVRFGGTWSTIGGRLRKHEKAYRGAFREAVEEMGPFPRVKVVDRHAARTGDLVYITFTAKAPCRFWPTNTDDHESDGYGWFTLAEVHALPLHPLFAKALRQLTREEGVA